MAIRELIRPVLAGQRILVVEDEFFLADDLYRDLTRYGADVVGPVAGLADAFDLLAADERIDLAVLDIDLRGEKVFDLAGALRARAIPFVFATGYGAQAIPKVYLDVPRLEKPYRLEQLVQILSAIVSRH